MRWDSLFCKVVKNILKAVAYAYMLECSDGTLYSGYTTDIDRRLKQHNAGKGSKYTRCRLPVKLVYYETFDNKHDAMCRECALKKLSRQEKLDLLDKITTNFHDGGRYNFSK